MDEERGGSVEEVKVQQVEEVDDLDYFGPDEAGTDEEHDESEVENVVQNKVAANIGGGGDAGSIVGEELRDIANLQ